MARRRKNIKGSAFPTNLQPGVTTSAPADNPAVPGEITVTEPQPCTCDENLLNFARAQWQIGDWDNLTQLNLDTLQHHPDRAKLALLAAAGHSQQGDASAARMFALLAQEWGCSKKLISQILIAGVHNSLGRAAAVIGKESLAREHFHRSIALGTPSGNDRQLTNARTAKQFSQLGHHFTFQLQYTHVTLSPINSDTQLNRRLDSSSSANFHEQHDQGPGRADQPTPILISDADEKLWRENYCIDPNYKSRSEYVHYDDMEAQDKWQLEVYLHAYAIMKKNNYKRVADIGCGSAYKLITYLGEFITTGYELPVNVELLKERYPDRDWQITDFILDNIDVDVIVCSDVIEHLVEPDELMKFLTRQNFQYLVISTPERDLVYDKDAPGRMGPPANVAHQREWNFQEFGAYVGSFFEVIEHKITNFEQWTQMIVCRRTA